MDCLTASVPEVSNAHACPIKMGRAPMMRMEWMSVRLGMRLGSKYRKDSSN